MKTESQVVCIVLKSLLFTGE